MKICENLLSRCPGYSARGYTNIVAREAVSLSLATVEKGTVGCAQYLGRRKSSRVVMRGMKFFG